MIAVEKKMSYLDVVRQLIGGYAEPVGETHTDMRRAAIQRIEEQLIDGLMEDMFDCLSHINDMEFSCKSAGSYARRYLMNMKDEIERQLERYGEEK